jgi:simple sugar transport system permease protein
LKEFAADFGWPRIIIFLFLVGLFVGAPFVGVSISASFSDVFNRFGQNAILVLALVPMVQSGCGLNFGLPVGIVAGLLGSTLAMQIGLAGWFGLAGAIAISLPFASLFGWLYGQLLNKVKGEEMTIAMYVGFSLVTFFSILWLLLPYSSPAMVWGYAGKGLRTTITLDNFWGRMLNNFLAGMLLFVALCVFIVYLFFRSKTGTATTAVGSNPDFARAGGVSSDRMRTISVMLSTVLGAIGIIVYQQSFGFIQLYQAPLYMAFPAVAALLIGGASVNKASMVNVIVGTFLFQGILTMTPSVINSVLQTDMSEVIRIVLSNGMILYALTRKTKVTK